MKRPFWILILSLVVILAFKVELKMADPVKISLEKENYVNDGKTSEPVKFILFNNTHRSIYFLTGCAARFPVVEIKEKNEWKQKQYLHPPLICTALPIVEEIKPLNKKTFQWNQRGTKGFLDGGTYRLGLAYSHQKKGRFSIGERQTIYSKPFTINKIYRNMLNFELNKSNLP